MDHAMRARYAGIGVLVVITVVIAVAIELPAYRPGAAPLSHTGIDTKAVEQAGYRGLQGKPTRVTSKSILFAEFNARLDPFSHDTRDPNTQFWLVFLKGPVNVADAPGQEGNPSNAQYNNMWLLLDTGGNVRSWGTQSPGYEIDLAKTPQAITSWPTPVNPK